jgi:hypothetical protein
MEIVDIKSTFVSDQNSYITTFYFLVSPTIPLYSQDLDAILCFKIFAVCLRLGSGAGTSRSSCSMCTGFYRRDVVIRVVTGLTTVDANCRSPSSCGLFGLPC